MNNNIPSDLLILDCVPKNLSESDLAKIIYSNIYEIVEPRIGVVLAISESEVGQLDVKLPYLEDKGFSFKNCIIEKVRNSEVCWDSDKFYTDLTRKCMGV